jgi:bifunctional non-homologous end joining protein LigD
MPTQAIGESVTLYYRAGGSDKVYQVAVEPSGTGFAVNFAFGRRGSTLQTGTKTPRPLAYEQAKKVYDQLIREKTAKGYSPGAGGTPYAYTPQESRSSGVLPQLLNPSKRPTSSGCWMTTTGGCRRSSTAAGCWSASGGRRSSASTAPAC